MVIICSSEWNTTVIDFRVYPIINDITNASKINYEMLIKYLKI